MIGPIDLHPSLVPQFKNSLLCTFKITQNSKAIKSAFYDTHILQEWRVTLLFLVTLFHLRMLTQRRAG